MKTHLTFFLLCFFGTRGALAIDPGAAACRVDWPAFLAQHDLAWEQFPPSWNTGGFTGNGQLGMMIYATLDDNRVDFHLGRADVTDHRKAPDRQTSFGVPGAGGLYDCCRLDVGRMALRPAGKIRSGNMRLNLWNAEATGVVMTDLGEVRFRAFTAQQRMIDVIDVVSTERTATGQPAPWRWDFLPGNPISPRRLVLPNENPTYQTNPEGRSVKVDGVNAYVQPLLAGGDYATAWQEQSTGPGAGTLFCTTANEVSKAGESVRVATQSVREAATQKSDDLAAANRAWWHGYYPASFLSVPDGELESLYWIQLYKFACASRPDGPLVDDDGPFFRINRWPYATWNLNVQLTYWLPLASNHLDLDESLINEVDQHFDDLLRAYGGAANIGDFTWAMHNYWLHYRFAGDPVALRAKWEPKAARLADCFLRRLVRGDDGKLHLPGTSSPEYPFPGVKGLAKLDDTNYGLALLRWLLNSLVEACPADPLAPAWKRTLADLTPLVVGPDGLMLAKDQPFAISHRHYSHLLSLYPLFQLDPDHAADRELAERSIAHWHHVGGGKALAGYSFSGAASLYAALGRGDDAYAMLQRFTSGNPLGTAYMSQNTFYFEDGGKNPVIETPLSAGAAVDQLLLQSWGGKLRVFPAVPKTWNEAEFHQLRGQGGFLVSASRKEGRTAWVSVKSLTGQPCRLRIADWTGALGVKSTRPLEARPVAPGDYDLDLRMGEEAVLFPAGQTVDAIVQPVPHPAAERNLYGVKANDKVPSGHVWPEKL